MGQGGSAGSGGEEGRAGGASEGVEGRGERGRAPAYLLEEYYFVKRGEPLKVVKLAKAVISHTSDLAFLRMAYSHLVWALRATGDLASSNAAASKALELSERAGGREEMLAFLATNMLLGGELSRAEELLAGFRSWQGVAKAKAKASEAYIRVNQPLEAVEDSGLACLLVRREDAGGFWSALVYRDALSPLLEAEAPEGRSGSGSWTGSALTG